MRDAECRTEDPDDARRTFVERGLQAVALGEFAVCRRRIHRDGPAMGHLREVGTEGDDTLHTEAARQFDDCGAIGLPAQLRLGAAHEHDVRAAAVALRDHERSRRPHDPALA